MREEQEKLQRLLALLVSRIPQGMLAIVLENDWGLEWCLDSDGVWHECYKDTDQPAKTISDEDYMVFHYVLLTKKVPFDRGETFGEGLAFYGEDSEKYIKENRERLLKELIDLIEELVGADAIKLLST